VPLTSLDWITLFILFEFINVIALVGVIYMFTLYRRSEITKKAFWAYYTYPCLFLSIQIITAIFLYAVL